MKQRLNIGIAAMLMACSLVVSGTVSAALNEPDCAALEQWSVSLSPDATFEPRPGITLSTLFQKDRVVPLFGAPVTEWSRDDISSAQRQLSTCRKQALGAKNREAGSALYAALKQTKLASRSLRKLWDARVLVERQVKNLLQLRPDPQLPEVLAIAQDALRGQETRERVAALPRQLQGYGGQAAKLKDISAVLTAPEIKPWIDQLEAKRTGATTSASADKAEHQAILDRIAAVPVAPEGLAMLNRIAYDADPGRMSREEQESFNRAVQSKRRQIQQRVAAREAKVKREMVNLPAPMPQVVKAVLQGDSAEAASLRGLHTGVSYPDIRQQAQRLWGYNEALTLDWQGKHLTTKRREFNRLMREERRDGGQLNVRTHDGVVGELSYLEHFPGLANIAPLVADLEARFGKPEENVDHGDGSRSLTWHEGEHYLRVRAGDRITPSRSHMGVRSSVEITLWTEAFAEYLEEATARCERLKNKPMVELSIREKQAIMMNCLSP